MSDHNTKPSGVFGAITGLLGLSIIAGVLVTALVTPAVAVTGMTAQGSIGLFESLPDYITLESQSQKNTIFALDDNQESVPIAQVFYQNREEIGWDDVNPYVKDALVAAEDRRFYEHGGVDITSTIRALLGNVVSSSIQSGASTLSMQLVKNIRIMRALDEETPALRAAALDEAQAQTVDRKLKEMKLAIGLEKRYTKNEILLGYLNIAGFGGNTYGIESAAKQFFSVSAKDLTLPQAASLIAIVQTPSKHSLNDEDNFERNTARRNLILNNMLDLGYITAEEHKAAKDTPLAVVSSPPQSGCVFATIGNFFCDYVERLVPELEGLGSTPEERQRNWERGGYDIHTTLDYSQQVNAQDRVSQEAPASENRFQLGSAISVVQPGTGRILAMAQNKTYNNSAAGGGPTTTAVNYNTDKKYGGSSGFQSGSTYKIFTLVEWLKQNHGLNETVNAQVRTYDQAKFTAPCTNLAGQWRVPNYGNAGGSSSTSVMRATSGSINSAFAAMAFKLDLCGIRDTALSMGVHRADGNELQPNPASILGTNEITPLGMAAAVATVTSGGKYCNPIAVDRIVNAEGEELPGQPQECEQAITAEVAAGAAYALRGVMTRGGTGAAANPGGNVIGKTGTTDGAVQLWMVGGTSAAALAVWTGNIVGFANLGRYTFGSGNGNSARFRMFQNIMGFLNGEYGAGSEFPAPPPRLLSGQLTTVPNTTGQTVEQAAALLSSLGFRPQDGGAQPSGVAAGMVIYTNPAGGSRVAQGSVVTYYSSDGSLTATMPDVIGDKREKAKAKVSAVTKGAITYAYVANADPDLLCKVSASNPAPDDAMADTAAVTLTVYSTVADEAPLDEFCSS